MTQTTGSRPAASAEPTPSALAVAWLTHPVTCLALAVLLVNDHVLKAAWGNALTGKLSDFAWLLVTPPLLAVVLAFGARVLVSSGPRPRPLVAASLGLAATAFVVVKTTAVGAATASAVLSAVAGSSIVLRDPSDLLALPALWLSWRVALPNRPSSREGWGRPGVRWMVVLPVAVLATAATSVPPPQGTASVMVVDGVVAASEDAGREHMRWHVSSDGVTWDRPESSEREDELTASFLAAGDAASEACVPSDPLECYRVGDGLGVDRSIDGGQTWVEDWAVPADVVVDLADRYRLRVDSIRTRAIAIRPTAGGVEVWAANGGDGLAVRHEDGTWTRLGFAYDDGAEVVPLPGEPTRFAYPLAVGLPYGLAASALVVLIGAVGRRRSTSRGVATAGAVFVLVALVPATFAAMTNGEHGAVAGQQVAADVLFGGLVVRALLVGILVAGAGLVVAGAVMLGRSGLAAPAALAALGVTLAAELPTPVLAATVSVAVVVAAVVVARRSQRRLDHAPVAPRVGSP